jgi:hypothetical protein
VATLGFIFIIWESLVRLRPTLFSTHLATKIEWKQSFPPAEQIFN